MQVQFFDSYPYRTLEPDLQALVLGPWRLPRSVCRAARCRNRRQATTESPFCIAASPAAEGETEEEQDAKADVNSLEREVDEVVYGLYGLTPEEIKLVEGTAK